VIKEFVNQLKELHTKKKKLEKKQIIKLTLIYRFYHLDFYFDHRLRNQIT